MQAPNGKFFYFKRSQYKSATEIKPGKDFKYEFWSEIIAYEVGTLLGFNVLRYDIAIDGEIMGCISESMINSEKEELIEGVKYLQAYSPDYDPTKKEHQTWYTFDLIKNALEAAKLKESINHIIEVIVFDALIGNGDRHQENWAMITHQRLITDEWEAMGKEEKEKASTIMKGSMELIKKLVDKFKEKKIKLPKSYYTIDRKFAPIYDSGSSLGRELLDEKISLYLTNEEELEKYINKGLSEIHWQNKKVSHFDLIRNLLQTSYVKNITTIVKKLTGRFDTLKIEELIQQIDREIPERFASYRIPESRKQLIFKLITLRFEKLKALIS